jgi:anaerobic selenocysteine-containing dehydrogenase/Fe-S-cluster-containing dehydrogenase component
LKIMGVAGASVIGGCSSEPPRKLTTYITSPLNSVPGEPSWYATTCRECPAGCGLLAKNRDGRVIKVEGNPEHPVSKGALCVRGQASLHGLYNPDRFRGPMIRTPDNALSSVTWKEAETKLTGILNKYLNEGKGDRIAFISEATSGSLEALIKFWLDQAGSEHYVKYEPFSYTPLSKANSIVFGMDSIPFYHINKADFLISFGADFIETWVSNVEYARQYGEFRDASKTEERIFVYVGPRLTLTAANADIFIPVSPGDEYLIALALIKIILDENLADRIDPSWKNELLSIAGTFSIDDIIEKTGTDKKLLQKLARLFAEAGRPLSIAGGYSNQLPFGKETAILSNLLCTLVSGTTDLMDFEACTAVGNASGDSKFISLLDKIEKGEIDILFILNANPAFTIPLSLNFAEKIKKVPNIISLSSCLDETTDFAHIILPSHTPLESWGDYSPREGVEGLIQPTMGNLFDTRQTGDILIGIGKRIMGEKVFPWPDYYEFLKNRWKGKLTAEGSEDFFESVWTEAVRKGGIWSDIKERGPINLKTIPAGLKDFRFPPPAGKKGKKNEYRLAVFPTIQFYDGRTANRPWLQEFPDPITQVTWGGWVEIHPDTARVLNINKGDMVRIRSSFGFADFPAIPLETVLPGTVAVPIGQGHKSFGRYADGLPSNSYELLPADMGSEGTGGRILTVTIERLDTRFEIANTDGGLTQQGRELVQTLPAKDLEIVVASGYRPHIDYPTPEGYDPAKDFYPPHQHDGYRWCMVVDLNKCVGCGACVVACYAENNLSIAGRKCVLQGREMSWLRVQRYFKENKKGTEWLVMMCQHCDNAPCESVCPVFAPHHSREGLNNQIYNRCIGTRFCSQNDPYKVRRFNWFTFDRPWPMDMQLNPDVTVRTKGVMEKCSFCIHRIADAKVKARNEGRKKVMDGEFSTACGQTCPTGAIIFGNLSDPESRVARLIKDPRAYQVLQHLNTKPAVIYLKKVTREI